MPFRIDKTKLGKYKLFNMHKKAYTKQTFNSKETAISSGKNSMRYRKETPIVVNKNSKTFILNKKSKDKVKK